MYITPTLRESEVGVLSFGSFWNGMGQWIPGGLSNAHNVAFIPSECTKNVIPNDGIKAFGSTLHQHTIGKALNFRHIRNGKELEPIDINLNYDFNYQQTIIFDQPKLILPGDQFILDCYTDSTKRDYITIGGESSSQEMCGVFLHYYPKIPVNWIIVSKTKSALKTWMKDAQIAGYLSGTPSDIDNGNFSTLSYNSLIDGALEFYNRLYSVDYDKYNQHDVYCYGNEDSELKITFTNFSRDESFDPYDLGLNDCDNHNVIVSECIPIDHDHTSLAMDRSTIIIYNFIYTLFLFL